MLKNWEEVHIPLILIIYWKKKRKRRNTKLTNLPPFKDYRLYLVSDTLTPYLHNLLMLLGSSDSERLFDVTEDSFCFQTHGSMLQRQGHAGWWSHSVMEVLDALFYTYFWHMIKQSSHKWYNVVCVVLYSSPHFLSLNVEYSLY